MASRSINKVILIGNLGQDPELRYTSSGVAVASFSMATGESWKDQDGNVQEKTQWHKLVAWRKLAEIVGEYLKKGSKVYIEGRIQYRSYDDKNGMKRDVTEIVVDQLLMLDSRGGGGQMNGSPAASAQQPAEESGADKVDDLPF
ncbi:MAG: single-stranded DNA-binding protein [Bacteroidetes bacterium]|nr:single-stranded DNA-binding protein [Bacteroidota bacterium]